MEQINKQMHTFYVNVGSTMQMFRTAQTALKKRYTTISTGNFDRKLFDVHK